ncbi:MULTISPECIES: hypothetical protein [unclassified Duganella]|jgi:hypothetical protein|uniref:hypothetical protein n=1 Tax=unclassified Duganella TaxID=2636909 RepID=UPI00087F40E3|nr:MULTISPECIES: hypothetical protein [unclassified Duganella]SDH08948.1 hypothetical protein SAMN05216320_109238 [Duganella sp. OV458]SDK17240.1 hypothetical protein SAMN05428973_10944 [Duganella sp. OV510]
MAVNTVAPSSSTAIQQAVPTRQPEQVKPVDRPAERVEQPPPPPPPQAATAPTVNTSGQRIGTTISTSA